MNILRRLTGWVDDFNDKIGVFIRWLVLIMVLFGAGGALVRYFSRGLGISMNLTPLIEAQWYAFSVIFLLGAAYGVNQDAHVRVDVMYARMTAKKRAWIDLGGTVIFLIPFCVMMLYVSFPAVRNSFSVREMSPDPGGLPRYPIKALILVSFALLVLQAVSQMVKQVDVIRGVAEGTPPVGHGVESPGSETEPATEPDAHGTGDAR